MPFCCFIAFSKHVKLCFRPLSGFVIPHIKMLGELGGGGGGEGGGRVYWNRRVLVSVSSCVCLLGFVQKISSGQLNLLYPSLIWWCIVLSRCHAQELGCYLQGQGHNKDLYNYNMTVSTISVLCCCCCFY